MIKKILGNGSVYYNKSKDSWVFDIRYTDENNKIKRKSIGGVSEKDARKKGDDFIACNEISSNSYSYKTFDEVFALIVKAKKVKGTAAAFALHWLLVRNLQQTVHFPSAGVGLMVKLSFIKAVLRAHLIPAMNRIVSFMQRRLQRFSGLMP